jgi:hypothetical protein
MLHIKIFVIACQLYILPLHIVPAQHSEFTTKNADVQGKGGFEPRSVSILSEKLDDIASQFWKAHAARPRAQAGPSYFQDKFPSISGDGPVPPKGLVAGTAS